MEVELQGNLLCEEVKMSSEELLRKKIKRLQKAQEEAESLLEEKSRELYLLNQNLEAQVKQRTEEFERARDEAIAANQAKSQFLANMSHEIRTPLNGMLGFIGLLEKTELKEIQKEQLSIVSKSGHLLLNIINDILDFSKIEAGKLEVDNSEFHLKRCVEDIVDVMSNQIYEKNLELPIYLDESIPKKLLGDEARLRQVLMNLIGNAAKFTPSGEISVEVHDQGKDELGRYNIYFEVRDTGVGISKKKLDSIFLAFEQADISDTRKYGGTGLGLTISQQIVVAMGGKLEVESKEGVGSKFYFTIPFEVPKNQLLERSDRSFGYKEEVQLFISNKTIRDNLQKRLQSWEALCTIIDGLNNIKWQGGREVKKNLILDHYVLSDEKVFEGLQELLNQDSHIVIIAPSKEKEQLFEKLKNMTVEVISKPVKREDLFKSIARKNTEKQKIEVAIEKKSNCSSSSKRHLLLVEDNFVNQQVATAMLEIHGFTLDIANNGQEAMNLFDLNKYELILMDCQMPIMSGLEATREIRKRDTTIPIIAMTANVSKKTKEECFDAGMNDFVTKPINDEDLAAVINKVLLKVKTQ